MEEQIIKNFRENVTSRIEKLQSEREKMINQSDKDQIDLIDNELILLDELRFYPSFAIELANGAKRTFNHRSLLMNELDWYYSNNSSNREMLVSIFSNPKNISTIKNIAEEMNGLFKIEASKFDLDDAKESYSILEQISNDYFKESDMDTVSKLYSAFPSDDHNEPIDYMSMNPDAPIDFELLRSHKNIFRDYHFDERLKTLMAKREKISSKLIKTKTTKKELEELDNQIYDAKLDLLKIIRDYYQSYQDKIKKKYTSFLEEKRFLFGISGFPEVKQGYTNGLYERDITSTMYMNMRELEHRKSFYHSQIEKLAQYEGTDLDECNNNINNLVEQFFTLGDKNIQLSDKDKKTWSILFKNLLKQCGVENSVKILSALATPAFDYFHNTIEDLEKNALELSKRIENNEIGNISIDDHASNNKQLGFAMPWILGILTGAVSVGLLMLGVFLN